MFKGFSVSARLNVWKRFSDVIMRLIESGAVEGGMLPLLGGLAPAFLLKVNAKLDLTIDEHMQNTLRDHPLVQPILMNGHMLVGATSSCEDDSDEALTDGLPLPIPLKKLVKALLQHMGDEITISATHPQLGVLVRISGEELSLVLRTVLKYLPGHQ